MQLDQLKARLLDEEWSAEKLAALNELHAKARAETREAIGPYGELERAIFGPYGELERALFGDPHRLMRPHEEFGLGFGASLMEGSNLCYFGIAGIPYTEDQFYQLWEENNWRSILEECPSAVEIEVGEQDHTPGMTDRFYWIAVEKPTELARELRTAILLALHPNSSDPMS